MQNFSVVWVVIKALFRDRFKYYLIKKKSAEHIWKEVEA